MSESTDFGYSYEYAVEINLGTDTEDWQPIRFISAVDPQVTPVTKDAATYDDHGAPNEVKLSESWTMSFTVQQQRTSTGGFLPELEKLLELAGPEAVGNASRGHFRWYDDPSSGAEASDQEAFEGYATVAVNRAQTGNDEIGSYAVTLTGRGRRESIENPANA